MVVDIIPSETFLYDIDVVDESMIGELGTRSMWNHSNFGRILRYIVHNCCVSNFNDILKAYPYPNCNQVIKKAGNMERHLAACKERPEYGFPKSVYQLRETLFYDIGSIGIPYFEDQKHFKDMALLDVESVCLQGDKFHDTDTTTWSGKPVLKSVSSSSNLIKEPIFLFNSNTKILTLFFVDALNGLGSLKRIWYFWNLKAM